MHPLYNVSRMRPPDPPVLQFVNYRKKRCKKKLISKKSEILIKQPRHPLICNMQSRIHCMIKTDQMYELLALVADRSLNFFYCNVHVLHLHNLCFTIHSVCTVSLISQLRQKETHLKWLQTTVGNVPQVTPSE